MADLTIHIRDSEPDPNDPNGQEGEVIIGGITFKCPELKEHLEKQTDMGAFSAAVMTAMTVLRKLEMGVLQREIPAYCWDLNHHMQLAQQQKKAAAMEAKANNVTPIRPEAAGNDDLEG